MRKLNENKLSNSYNNKKFSSANLAFIIIEVLTIAISIYQGLMYMKGWSLFEIAFVIFFMVNIMILINKKFPLFVTYKQLDNNNLENYGKKYEKNIGFLSRLYLMIFTSEPSCFVSLFSNTT